MRSILANLVPKVLFPRFGVGTREKRPGDEVGSWHCKLIILYSEGPNNYIKRAFPHFSSFSVVRPAQYFGINKKKKEKSLTFLTLINSFNLKDEHYNNISRHKRFGGVSFLLWNRPSYSLPYWFCFGLVTMSCHALGSGGRPRKNGARERDTCISSRARSLSCPTSKRLLHSYISRCFQAPP